MGRRVYKMLRWGLLVCALWASGTPAWAEDTPLTLGSYELGRGLALGDTGFTLGGYATARLDDPHNTDPSLSLDHLSMMLWWEGTGRWKFLSEIDVEQGVATRRDYSDDERFYSLERFYVDYALNDTTTVRAGKFLTPIGRWNAIHADPLVWTTSRPLVTDQVFPGTATGGMLQGTLSIAAQDLDYSVFLAGGKEWRAKPSEDPFSEARGVHVNLPLDGALQVGVSLASYEQESAHNDHRSLAGLDFLWAQARWELSGEAVYTSSSDGAEAAQRGGYVQAVAPLSEHLYAVGRAEWFHFAGQAQNTQAWVLGLNYRYARALSFKVEVLSGAHLPPDVPSGVLASVSVLF